MTNDRRAHLDASPEALRRAFAGIAPDDAQTARWREAMRSRQTAQFVARERVPWIWVGASAAAAVLAIASTLVIPLSSEAVLAGAEQPWRAVRMNVESTVRAPVDGLMRFVPGEVMVEGEASDSEPDAMGASMTDGPAMTGATPGLMPHVPMIRMDWLTDPIEHGWSMVKPLFGGGDRSETLESDRADLM